MRSLVFRAWKIFFWKLCKVDHTEIRSYDLSFHATNSQLQFCHCCMWILSWIEWVQRIVMILIQNIIPRAVYSFFLSFFFFWYLHMSRHLEEKIVGDVVKHRSLCASHCIINYDVFAVIQIFCKNRWSLVLVNIVSWDSCSGIKLWDVSNRIDYFIAIVDFIHIFLSIFDWVRANSRHFLEL